MSDKTLDELLEEARDLLPSGVNRWGFVSLAAETEHGNKPRGWTAEAQWSAIDEHRTVKAFGTTPVAAITALLDKLRKAVS